MIFLWFCTCKLVRNRCVIEGFGGVLCCRVLDFSVGVGIFVMGLSQISSFFSTYFNYLFQSFKSKISILKMILLKILSLIDLRTIDEFSGALLHTLSKLYDFPLVL